MTIKPMQIQLSEDPHLMADNIKLLADNTTFKEFTMTAPTVTGWASTCRGFYCLLGPLCYYHIIIPGAISWTTGNGLVYGCPYGPFVTAPGKVGFTQVPLPFIDTVSETWVNAAEPTCFLTWDGGPPKVPVLRLPDTGAGGATFGASSVINGWFIRDMK